MGPWLSPKIDSEILFSGEFSDEVRREGRKERDDRRKKKFRYLRNSKTKINFENIHNLSKLVTYECPTVARNQNVSLPVVSY